MIARPRETERGGEKRQRSAHRAEEQEEDHRERHVAEEDDQVGPEPRPEEPLGFADVRCRPGRVAVDDHVRSNRDLSEDAEREDDQIEDAR